MFKKLLRIELNVNLTEIIRAEFKEEERMIIEGNEVGNDTAQTQGMGEH